MLEKLKDMTAMMDGISINTPSTYQSRPSSFGLLPESLLRASEEEHEDDFDFKKPFSLPKSSKKEKEETFELNKAHALPSYLLQAQTPMSNRSAVDISALYNTTLDANDSAVDAFNWTKEVFNPEMNLDLTKKVAFQTPSKQPLPPKIAIKAPSGDVSGNDSFYKGSLSGRSTSIGSGSASDVSKTLDEKFDDFSKNGTFGSNPFKMGDDEFGPVVSDNLALMNEDEKKTEMENQFVQHDTMPNAHGVSFKNGFVDPSESGIMDMTSKSQFFSSNSSRLGSLESSVMGRPGSEELRPNLGLGKIISPEKDPVKMIETTLNKTFNKTFSTKEKRDLKAIIMDKGANSEDLKNHLKNLLFKNEPNESIAPEALTSFLELTSSFLEATRSNETQGKIVKTQRHSSPVKLPKPPTKSKIPVRSPGKQPKEQNATLTLSKTAENGTKLTKIPMRPPNANKNMGAAPENQTNRSSLFPNLDPNYSLKKSPKNISKQKSSPLKQAIGPKSTFSSAQFPIQSNKLKIDWIPTPVNGTSEQIVTLKNILDQKLVVNLAIMKSDEFIFKQKRQQEISITFDPRATVSIEVLFIPLTDGEKNAVLTIRVQGFRNHRGIAVKSSVPFHGLAESEFQSMPIEETMSETLMDMTNFNHTRQGPRNDLQALGSNFKQRSWGRICDKL